jgi:hypothetical protein
MMTTMAPWRLSFWRLLGIFLALWLTAAAAAACYTKVKLAFYAQGALGVILLIVARPCPSGLTVREPVRKPKRLYIRNLPPSDVRGDPARAGALDPATLLTTPRRSPGRRTTGFSRSTTHGRTPRRRTAA